MNDSFADSRASLRSLMGISRPAQGDLEPWTPRSKLMRLAMRPESRAIFLAAATLATLAFPRIARARAVVPLVSRAGSYLLNLRIRR